MTEGCRHLSFLIKYLIYVVEHTRNSSPAAGWCLTPKVRLTQAVAVVVSLLLEMFQLSKHLITLEILLLDLHIAYFLRP